MHPVGAAVGGTGGTAAGGTNYGNKDDYIPHHEPFQYYASTANPHHLAPASLAAIGTDTQTTVGGVPQFDTANHQYDTSDFDSLVGAISHGYVSPDHLPAVSFLKAPGYQDGHAGYSDPIDEQQFIVNEINALEHTPDWSSTAVVVAYDDSDGWYDHVYSGVHNTSNTAAVATPPGPQDFLTGTGLCGDTAASNPPLAGENGRCGYGPRLPLLVISPWAKKQLRRPHADRPELDPEVHRGQLAAARDRRLVRRHRRHAEPHVRLRKRSQARQRNRCSSTRRPGSPTPTGKGDNEGRRPSRDGARRTWRGSLSLVADRGRPPPHGVPDVILMFARTWPVRSFSLHRG